MISNERDYSDFGQYVKEKMLKNVKKELKTPLTEQIQQIIDVEGRLTQVLGQEYSENKENIDSIHYLLITLPAFWRFTVETAKVEWIRKAKEGLVFLLKADHATNLADNLLRATIPQSSSSTHLSLNDEGGIMSRNVAQVLTGSQIVFFFLGQDINAKDVLKRARDTGSQHLLDALALPDQPLLPYPRRIVQEAMGLNPNYYNGGSVGSLPTRVTGVNAQYVYLGPNEKPIISLSIAKTP